jgi:replicative DNA helicase
MVDLITLSAETAKEAPAPEEMLMAALQSGGGMPSFLPQWASILEDRMRRRALSDMASQVLKAVTDPSQDPASLADMAASMMKVSSAKGGAIGMQEASMMLLNSLTEERKACSTGIADLDRLTGGFRGGKMIVIGARPGVGKTALALHIATHVARHTGPVLIVSLEMDETEITARLCAAESGVDVQLLESGKLSADDWMRVTPATAEIAKLPIRITTEASTPLQVRREAHRVKESQGLAMVVVDYIQLMRCDGKRSSRYEEVSEISRELKLLAMDLGVPVMALTQFNRDSEAGKNGQAQKRPPRMAEAKDSGSIEQDANMFIVQFAPGSPGNDPRDQEAATMCEGFGHEWQQLIIEKNRQGRTGVIDVGFDKAHMRFVNLARD